MSDGIPEMKLRVARTVKWNVIDKFLSMILYSVTGIILARVLPNSDFGLIGAALIFSAFASLFIDSGFSSALIQKKEVTDLDYSTVLWFNVGMAVVIYIGLYFAAPLIATLFQNDLRLIPVSRVIFLTFIFNATAIVQANRLVKQMNVRLITVANSLSLFAGSVLAVWMSLNGYGVWSLVWQSVSQSALKSLILWIGCGWVPLFKASYKSLRTFFSVGFGMMGSSFLNTVFKNIYAFAIGNRAGINSLSYYTQADKWSTMGISSLSAIFTQSFLPALSEYQDEPRKFASATAKMNRTTSYLLFPFCGVLIATAAAIFHFLFEHKWDDSIYLFQLLLIRGIFTVLCGVYNNYILALGRTKLIVVSEIIRDAAAIIALIITWGYIAIEKPGDITYGIGIMLWGQVIASFITWGITLWMSAKLSFRTWWQFVADSVPYLVITVIIFLIISLFPLYITTPLLLVICQSGAGVIIYLFINFLLKSKIQQDVLFFVFNRMQK
ncbi:MAG: lipopolysaccharide biosynthesis protein [Paramuribaculum sp.]|nr:lipopolysaccharide biosynthesis protein [Paramuribaculum sp.]